MVIPIREPEGFTPLANTTMPAFMWLQSAMASMGFTAYAEISRRIIGSYDNEAFNQDRDNNFKVIRAKLEEVQRQIILDFHEMTRTFKALQPAMIQHHVDLEKMKLNQIPELTEIYAKMVSEVAQKGLQFGGEGLQTGIGASGGQISDAYNFIDQLGHAIGQVIKPGATIKEPYNPTQGPTQPPQKEPEPPLPTVENIIPVSYGQPSKLKLEDAATITLMNGNYVFYTGTHNHAQWSKKAKDYINVIKKFPNQSKHLVEVVNQLNQKLLFIYGKSAQL